MADRDDMDLLERCLSREAGAWDEFVRRFGPVVLGAIRATFGRYGFSNGVDLSGDIFQQTFLALYEDDHRRLRTYSGARGASLATWLRVVAARQAVDGLRRRDKRTTPLEGDPNGNPGPTARLANPSPLPPEIMADREVVEFLKRELAQLPPRERLVMGLRFGEGLSGEATARAAGLKRNHVDQIVHRVKAELRRRAAEEGLL